MSDDKDSKLSSTRREETSTEQSQSEELLKAREYLDLAEVMFGELNSKGIIVFVNRKYCEVLGYDRDEIIGKDWFKTFLPKRFRKETYDIFRSLMKGKIERVEYFENPVLTKDGEERIIAWRNTVLTDEAGKITGTLSSGEDITERKRAEEEKASLEAQLMQAQKMETIGTL
ncbi:MAG: PAS domain S-box protein, partial [Candidatus Thorarchaeota archaeon]|nr:PAS domain S-box protein [Candidatus Thorarchaeota archaeon]